MKIVNPYYKINNIKNTKFISRFYIKLNINNIIIPYIIDTGATITTITYSLMKLCGLEPLLEPFNENICGVYGLIKVRGILINVKIKVENNVIYNNLIVLDDDNFLLFGNDIMKKLDTTIDLHKNNIKFNNKNINFYTRKELFT